MTVGHSDLHARLVDQWETKFSKSVKPSDHSLLYGMAIQKVIHRTLGTLSGVTVDVVVDRVISEASAIYPALGQIKIANHTLNFADLLNSSTSTPKETKAALREVLIRLLTVIGSITADILTVHLHAEVVKIADARQLSTKKREQE